MLSLARRTVAGTALVLAAALSSTLLVGLATATPAAAAVPVPPTRSGLTAAIELPQPYIGQSVCDPVAKPGVAAFRDLVLRTYPGTGNLGIVRDCGIGGQSEHKEGRAWDWGVSVSNATQVSQVDALLGWLLKTDQYGNAYANARRLGIMYIIWNRHIWKAYDPRWQSYSGADPHTGHVHFSFGWNGARKATSYWDGTVAPIDWGPAGFHTVTPVRAPANIAVLKQYGSTVLKLGSSGTAVSVLQQGLKVKADGSYGAGTAAAVEAFKTSQHLTVDGVTDAATWKALFPPPIDPFGAVSATRTPEGMVVSGWALDADSSDPLAVALTVDGTSVATGTADTYRSDVAASYPDTGGNHGFRFVPALTPGSHTLCVRATNAPGSPGKDAVVGCRTVTFSTTPAGAVEAATQVLAAVRVSGWALDPDTANTVPVDVTVDGSPATTVSASAQHAALPAGWGAYGTSRGWTADLSVATGTHTVCATVADVAAAGGQAGPAQALGCRTVTVQHTPVGAVERLQLVPGGVRATGWAVDPDTTSPVTTTVTVDGSTVGTVTADDSRPDLAARLGAAGTAHGWSLTHAVAAGQHTVCATAANAATTAGAASGSLGCLSVTVGNDARGGLRTIRTQPGGTALVSGWALDPDTAAATTVSVTLDGAPWKTVTAGSSYVLPSTWSAFGSGHGLSAALPVPAGRHTLCVTALNAGGTPGAATALGCGTVVMADPHGGLDWVAAGTGRYTVRGWALDPDSAAMSAVTIWTDGRSVTRFGAGESRTDELQHFPGYGPRHGYLKTVTVRRGYHTVCVVAGNTAGTPGKDVRLGCQRVYVR